MAWTNPPSVTTLTGITATWGQNVTTDLTIFGTAWTAYTPTITGFTSAVIVSTGAYMQAGKLCVGHAEFHFTSLTTAGSSGIGISLPVQSGATARPSIPISGNCVYHNSGQYFQGFITIGATATALGLYLPSSGTASTTVNVTGANPPNAWSSTASVNVWFTYETS